MILTEPRECPQKGGQLDVPVLFVSAVFNLTGCRLGHQEKRERYVYSDGAADDPGKDMAVKSDHEHE